MKKIVLRGELGKKFGRTHWFDLNTPAEAIRALSANFTEFANELAGAAERGVGYMVHIGKDAMQSLDEIDYPSGKSEEGLACAGHAHEADQLDLVIEQQIESEGLLAVARADACHAFPRGDQSAKRPFCRVVARQSGPIVGTGSSEHDGAVRWEIVLVLWLEQLLTQLDAFGDSPRSKALFNAINRIRLDFEGDDRYAGNFLRRAPFTPLLIETSHIAPCYAYRDRAEGESDEGEEHVMLVREMAGGWWLPRKVTAGTIEGVSMGVLAENTRH